MDYKEIMKGNFDFPSFYFKAVEKRFIKYNIPQEVREKLLDKLNFGLEKYKDYSFQSNFKNSITSPAIEHAEEEVIDFLNYLLHIDYVFSAKGILDEKNSSLLKTLIQNAKDSLEMIKELEAQDFPI